MELYNEIHGAPIFDVYDDDDEEVVHDYGKPDPVFSMRSNMEYNEDLEVCLREVKNEFQNFKLGMAEIIRSFEESVNRLLEAAIRNISARGRARGGNARRSERSNATSHHTNQNVRDGTIHINPFYQAQTLPIRRHHRISRARKWHRYGRKRKMTRTKKKMKKVSGAERRKKRQGKKLMTIVLTCRQGLLPSEATWKDAQAFLRTLRTRFFGGWSIDKIIPRLNQRRLGPSLMEKRELR